MVSFDVPPLTVKPPGPGLRALGLVFGGIREVSGQIGPYTRWWSEANDDAVARTIGGTKSPLWFVVGDSTCLGIGASGPDRGWVGRCLDRLRSIDEAWHVVNVAMSGARIGDVVATQAPILADLLDAGGRPALVTCCVGTNDVLWSRAGSDELTDAVGQLVERFPSGTQFVTVAGGSSKVGDANRHLRASAEAAGHHVVDPWREPGPGPWDRVAADRFHPNDLGHRLMADAIGRSMATILGLPETRLSPT